MVRSKCSYCDESRETDEKYVIFDLYGTLVDWRYTITRFIEFYVGKHAVEDFFKCDIERVSKGYVPYKDILKECLSRVAGLYSVVLSDEVLDAFVLAFAKSPPFPDVVYGLLMLKKLGYKVCVLSNTDKDLVEITLAGIRNFFDYVITAGDVRAYKPSVEAFTRAYEILSASPENVVHVSAYPEYDLIPASKLGARTVLIDRGLGYNWYITVKNLLELPMVLEG